MNILTIDIATIICDKCINSETNRSFTRLTIEKTLRKINYSVKANKSAKQQALALIKDIQRSQVIPLERAKMRLKITIPKAEVGTFTPTLESDLFIIEQSEDNDEAGAVLYTVLIEPHKYREADISSKQSKGQLEVLVHSVKPDEEGELEFE